MTYSTRAENSSAYRPHPLATKFPPIKGSDFDALVADIKANGLIEPIILYEGMILDGVHRARACRAAGVEPVYRPFNGNHDEARALVVSLNAHRRHLTPEAKDKAIADLLKADPAKSDRQIAQQVGRSHPHVAKIRKKMEQAGDVETVSTRSDIKGRNQPARKPGTTKIITADRRKAEYAADERADPAEDIEEQQQLDRLVIDDYLSAIRDLLEAAETMDLAAVAAQVRASPDISPTALFKLSSWLTQLATELLNTNKQEGAALAAGDPGPMPDLLRREGGAS